MRLAFVGQRVYFGDVALHVSAGGVEPRFFDLRPGSGAAELIAGLRHFDPHVVVAFRPELLPPGALGGLGAVRVGFLTEPLPRPGRPPHPDLDLRLEALRGLDPGNVDRLVTYDPYIAPTVDPIFPVWRSLPLPVSDALFAPVRRTPGPPRLVFVGRATPHRDAFLDPVKHDFDVLHIAHGVTDAWLGDVLAGRDAGINLHNEPYPNYENRVSTLLAAGLAVLSERLSPRWGLRPGVDYVEVDEPWELWEVAVQLARTPDALRSMRMSGRRKAERFRASHVWPALAREALDDVAAFGSERPADRDPSL